MALFPFPFLLSLPLVFTGCGEDDKGFGSFFVFQAVAFVKLFMLSVTLASVEHIACTISFRSTT